MVVRFCFFLCTILLLTSSCNTVKNKELIDQTSTEIQEFENWKQGRIDGLKSPFGWLSLTGLYWMKDDSLSIGTMYGFDINLSFDASAKMGTLTKEDGGWLFEPAQKNLVKHEFNFVNEKIELLHDQTGNPTILNYESLFWYLIKREDNYGIRLKDTLNEDRLALNHIPIFDFDKSLMKKAKVNWASETDTILITNAQGVVSSTPLKGWLEFEHKGDSYSLAGIDGGPNTWFIIFGDKTNSAETYGAGRFVYVPVTEGTDFVNLDFNRAENPPCYFTSFATCPLPPKENKLEIAIRAGERSEH